MDLGLLVSIVIKVFCQQANRDDILKEATNAAESEEDPKYQKLISIFILLVSYCVTLMKF